MATTAHARKIISEVLKLDLTSDWEIVSQNEDENIYMVHHSKDANLENYGSLRGVVVDIVHKTVISHSYPYSPKVVANTITLDIDGNIHLKDDNNTTYTLDPKNVRFKTGFEGTLMHVFKHNGNVYRTTRKKLDPSRSRWGNSVKFTQMYWDLGGPADEILFAEDKKYSPYCHTFIMCHPDVLVATKDEVGSGNLIYLGPKQMYFIDPDQCPFPLEDVDTDLHIPETCNESNKGIIYQPENLTLEEANKHLLFGFYDGFEGYEYLDTRLLPGEFVIIEILNKYGDMIKVLRVESPAYTWRCFMRNNNPNIQHRFFELVDNCYLKNDAQGKSTYENLFPILTAYDVKILKNYVKTDPILVWPQKSSTFPRTRQEKLHNIWQCLLVSVPFHHQTKVVKYLDQLVEKKNELVNWLNNLSYSRTDPELFSRRAKDILIKTRKFANNRVQKGENHDVKTGKLKSADEITKENIKNFINKELGPSLYRLVREMDKFKAELLKQKEEEKEEQKEKEEEKE